MDQYTGSANTAKSLEGGRMKAGVRGKRKMIKESMKKFETSQRANIKNLPKMMPLPDKKPIAEGPRRWKMEGLQNASGKVNVKERYPVLLGPDKGFKSSSSGDLKSGFKGQLVFRGAQGAREWLGKRMRKIEVEDLKSMIKKNLKKRTLKAEAQELKSRNLFKSK